MRFKLTKNYTRDLIMTQGILDGASFIVQCIVLLMAVPFLIVMVPFALLEYLFGTKLFALLLICISFLLLIN